MASVSVDNPSLCVARLLDHIIGTEEQVLSTQRFILESEYCENLRKDATSIHTGSFAEGYRLQSSDIDFMMVNHCVVVLESLQRDVENHKDQLILLMRRDDCHPGYVILQLISHLHYINNDYLVEWKNCLVLSSTLFRDDLCSKLGSYNNGPCMFAEQNGYDIDVACSFECKKWPTEANAFFYRPRPNGWPCKRLLDHIRRKGCHLVAVGDKTSDLVEIQWRISFAVAERMLVHSFNHTQLRLYVLMKIFHKQLIETYNGVEELLCSYFMKTLMFLMVESTDPLIWTEGNFISLFWRCFMKLIQWVQDGYCPNYFIPENNLFKSKIYGKNQDNLVKVLHEIKREGWKSIYRCADLKDLQYDSFNLRVLQLRYDAKNYEARKDLKVLNFLNCRMLKCLISDCEYAIRNAVQKVMKIINNSKIRSDNDMSVVLSRFMFGVIGQCMFQNVKTHDRGNNIAGNKQRNKLLKMCERLLLEGAKFDISRGPLNLALFYYAINRYDKVIQICRKVISRLPTCREDHFIWYEEFICGRGMHMADKMKRAVAFHVIVESSCKLFYPKELQHVNDSFACPPLIFAIFLMFLCYHEQGDIDSSLSALHDLKAQEEGMFEDSTFLILLAICLDKVGDKAYAVETCMRSLRLRHKEDNLFGRRILNDILSRT